MRSPTLPVGLGCALALLASSQALAGPALLVPDFSDSRDPVEGIRARAEILRALGAYEDVQIAPLFKYKKLAPKYRLNPKQLGTAHAASILGRYERIDGVLSGVALDHDRTRILRLALYDATGVALFNSDLTLTAGALAPQSVENAAKGIAKALGSSMKARPTPNPRPGGAPPPSGAAAGGDNRYPPATGDDSGASPEGTPGSDGRYAVAGDSPPEPEAVPKAGEPLFEVGLSLPFSLRDFSLTDPSLTPSTFLTYDTASPYTGVAADFALFPLAHMSYWLQGIGLLGSFSIGFINNSYTNAGGTTTPFTSQDLRVGGDLTYRLHLEAIKDASGAPAIYNPSIGLRVGFAYFDYSVDPNNPVDLQNIVRTPIKIGLDYLQPIGSWLRLGLGGQVYLLADPGAAEEDKYGTSSSLGWGFHFTATGLFGLAGLGYQVKLDYLDFTDHYNDTNAAVPGVSTGTETYLDLWFGLTYSIQ
jgi:hypothetical protein